MEKNKINSNETVFLMHNEIMEYSWGTQNFISELTGVKNPDGVPQAELWLGAHPKAPSKVTIEAELLALDHLIGENPEKMLGKKASRAYQGLPFLFKVLSAAQPLSIQVHPNQEQARRGFAAEEERKLPLDARIRNYKDANHKPELLMALTPFSAMTGIRDYDEIGELVELLRLPDKIAEFGYLGKNLTSDHLRDFMEWILGLKSRERKKVRNNILRAALLRRGCDHRAALGIEWICRLDKFYPEDIGIFAPLILNTIQMQPGEAIYMNAGILHAYLEGSGLEIMANSDNVLRCGLTPKHIDIKELSKIARFEASQPNYIKPGLQGIEEIYKSPAQEFMLSRIKTTGDYQIRDLTAPQIILNLGSRILIKPEAGNSLTLKRGESAYIRPQAESCHLQGNSVIYRAQPGGE